MAILKVALGLHVPKSSWVDHLSRFMFSNVKLKVLEELFKSGWWCTVAWLRLSDYCARDYSNRPGLLWACAPKLAAPACRMFFQLNLQIHSSLDPIVCPLASAFCLNWMNKTPTSDTCRYEIKAASAGVQEGILFFSDISTCSGNRAKVTDTTCVNSAAAHLKHANLWPHACRVESADEALNIRFSYLLELNVHVTGKST